MTAAGHKVIADRVLLATNGYTDGVPCAPAKIKTGADKTTVHRKTATAVGQVGFALVDTATANTEQEGAARLVLRLHNPDCGFVGPV